MDEIFIECIFVACWLSKKVFLTFHFLYWLTVFNTFEPPVQGWEQTWHCRTWQRFVRRLRSMTLKMVDGMPKMGLMKKGFSRSWKTKTIVAARAPTGASPSKFHFSRSNYCWALIVANICKHYLENDTLIVCHLSGVGRKLLFPSWNRFALSSGALQNQRRMPCFGAFNQRKKNVELLVGPVQQSHPKKTFSPGVPGLWLISQCVERPLFGCSGLANQDCKEQSNALRERMKDGFVGKDFDGILKTSIFCRPTGIITLMLHATCEVQHDQGLVVKGYCRLKAAAQTYPIIKILAKYSANRSRRTRCYSHCFCECLSAENVPLHFGDDANRAAWQTLISQLYFELFWFLLNWSLFINLLCPIENYGEIKGYELWVPSFKSFSLISNEALEKWSRAWQWRSTWKTTSILGSGNTGGANNSACAWSWQTCF